MNKSLGYVKGTGQVHSSAATLQPHLDMGEITMMNLLNKTLIINVLKILHCIERKEVGKRKEKITKHQKKNHERAEKVFVIMGDSRTSVKEHSAKSKIVLNNTGSCKPTLYRVYKLNKIRNF